MTRRAMTPRPLRRTSRRLRHAVRGLRPDGPRPGARWCRLARPPLIGPPIDPVLVRPARPVVFDRRDQRVSVRPHIAVEHHTNSVRPTLIQRIVDRTMRIRRERTASTRPGPVVLRRVVVQPSVVPGPVHREIVSIRDRRHATARPMTRPESRPTAPVVASEPSRRATHAARTSVPIPTAYRPAHRPTVARSQPVAPPQPAIPRTDQAWPTAGVERDRRARVAPAPVIDVDDLTRRVVSAIDRRLVSQRERLGRR